jgi:DICT domain-containing protein
MTEAMSKDYRIRTMQFWRLTVSDQSAALVAEADAGEDPFIRQEIEYTDFPLDKIEIWAGYDGNRWTLYLPSEH